MIGLWRAAVHRGLSQAQDVVRVLMKPRNGVPWTPEERAFLMKELRRVAWWTPALLLFLVPGSTLLLPVLAWGLDRRRRVALRLAPPGALRPLPGAPAGPLGAGLPDGRSGWVADGEPLGGERDGGKG